ncbi:hypothetical protein [Nocardia ninae]|nr:hypothetical protein [Nocardia ninae]
MTALVAVATLAGAGWIATASTAYAADPGYECALVFPAGGGVYGHDCSAVGGAPEAGKFEKAGEDKYGEKTHPEVYIRGTVDGEKIACITTYISKTELHGIQCEGDYR